MTTANQSIRIYLNAVNKQFQSGIAGEHAYRGDLQTLLNTFLPDVYVTNEPRNVTDCGNPDYVLMRGSVPVAYIEAKDVGADLTHKKYREQFNRYRKALDNLAFTDYLTFRFYEHGERVDEVQIATIEDGKIVPLPDNFGAFHNRIRALGAFVGQTIKSPQKLAELMAAKARLLQTTLEAAVTSDETTNENSALREQLNVFRNTLITDITPKQFADMYAQTLAYGLFAARLYDDDLETFTRQEAAELIPKSNPFLRKLFSHIAGIDIDERIRPTVDNLADLFQAADVAALLATFGTPNQKDDPIIHFYETFLAEYDPKLRKSRGVWYTPAPVVDFIVRAVDDVLKTEFGLANGLADGEVTPDQVHRVQILDPATGTGTFLAAVIKHIHHTYFINMQGAWSGYVERDLIPRLNGFELLMASYAMAHLKLDLLLRETGYTPHQNNQQQRFNVYLTNALEEHHPDTQTLFSTWLADEAREANRIKRDTPVMVVMGNPPYSGESQNKGEWIMSLMEAYKKEPGGVAKLQERNPKWINNDYVKFLRYGQHLLEQSGEGVLAFINPHGFLDNPTFRGVRWQLLNTFDTIYTIDLHGSSKKREVAPDGSADDNVFDIQQGVSINIFIKTNKKAPDDLAQVFHYDLYGRREQKYQFLSKNRLSTIDFTAVTNSPPMYFMVQKDFATEDAYNAGFALNDFFTVHNVGIVTSRDTFIIDSDKQALSERIRDFFALETAQIKLKYGLVENSRWQIDRVKQKAGGFDAGNVRPIAYRPFDNRFIYHDNHFIERSREEVMQHFLRGENFGLVFSRQSTEETWTHIQLVDSMIDNRIHFSYTGIPNEAPLYLYGNGLFNGQARQPNLNHDVVDEIAKGLGLRFVVDHAYPEAANDDTFTPLDLLDYIYAVLHAPTYRDTYKAFLKIDFPRVPYPDPATFPALITLGAQLRELHLMTSPRLNTLITNYPHSGDNIITRKLSKRSPGFIPDANDPSINQVGNVWINDTQCFAAVPLSAWEFFIGGYQPAQKWLKDRRGRQLTFNDIRHYQKIIVALTETERIMGEIDRIIVNIQ